jgi:hypothetical protein
VSLDVGERSHCLDRGIPKGGAVTHHPTKVRGGSGEGLGWPRELESCYRHARNAERQGQDVPDSRGHNRSLSYEPAFRVVSRCPLGTSASRDPLLHASPGMLGNIEDRS